MYICIYIYMIESVSQILESLFLNNMCRHTLICCTHIFLDMYSNLAIRHTICLCVYVCSHCSVSCCCVVCRVYVCMCVVTVVCRVVV